MTTSPDGDSSLICSVRGVLLALPLASVVETMRPLRTEAVAGVPSPVRGLAIIRGVPTAVVDLGWVLAGEASNSGRFVTVKVGPRRVALAVDTVIGVRAIPQHTLSELPPLLSDANTDAVTAVATLDHQLLLALEAARLIPDSAWNLLSGGVST